MNTIPLTFNEDQANVTVLGGIPNDRKGVLDVSIILINSHGSHLKLQLLEELLKCNVRSIICIEPDSENFSLEEISRKFPEVKFVMPHENMNIGRMINMAVSECTAKYFYVIRDSFYIPQGLLNENMFNHLTAQGKYCVVPRLVNSEKEGIAQIKVPSAKKGRFVVESRTLVTDGLKTLYPFDFSAIYDREKFIQLGGFDYTIDSPYWQNLDLGVRSWLWGEETVLSTVLQLSYQTEVTEEDRTPSLDSLRFFLKNQLPVFRLDHGAVPHFSFGRFFRRSSCGIIEALRLFRDAKRWIYKNRYRFRMDLKTLVETW